MQIKISLVIAAIFIFMGCAPKQKIIVTPSANSNAKLEFFDGEQKILDADVKIGKNGVAKIGEKQEGDGKTPSGTYKILALFAYEKQTTNMPFLFIDDNLICVDDVNSTYYNKILLKQNAHNPQSYENMKRQDGQYALGAVIDYNGNGEKNLGSCIFIHIYKDKNSATAGCVALSEKDMLTLFKNLDVNKEPTITIMY